MTCMSRSLEGVGGGTPFEGRIISSLTRWTFWALSQAELAGLGPRPVRIIASSTCSPGQVNEALEPAAGAEPNCICELVFALYALQVVRGYPVGQRCHTVTRCGSGATSTGRVE